MDFLFCFLIAVPHSLLICFSFAAQCLAVLLFASSPAGFHRSTYCCRPCQCNRKVGQKQAGKWGSWRQFSVCVTSMRLPGPCIYAMFSFALVLIPPIELCPVMMVFENLCPRVLLALFWNGHGQLIGLCGVVMLAKGIKYPRQTSLTVSLIHWPPSKWPLVSD